jgi:hypothetical protein
MGRVSLVLASSSVGRSSPYANLSTVLVNVPRESGEETHFDQSPLHHHYRPPPPHSARASRRGQTSSYPLLSVRRPIPSCRPGDARRCPLSSHHSLPSTRKESGPSQVQWEGNAPYQQRSCRVLAYSHWSIVSVGVQGEARGIYSRVVLDASLLDSVKEILHPISCHRRHSDSLYSYVSHRSLACSDLLTLRC